MSHTHSGTCACGKAAAACPAAASTPTTAPAKTGGIQNGKGDAPRNISEKFIKNYGGIKWKTGGKLKKGEKFVKVYG